MAAGALLLASAVWGWTFVLVKDALAEVGPLGFLALRFSLATLLALPVSGRGAWSGRSWRWGVPLGLALFAGYLFQTWGLLYTTAGKSGLITGLSVVLVPLWATAWGRRPDRRTWAGVLLAGGGVALLALGGEGLAGGAWLGDFLTVLCAFSFALHLVLIEESARAVPPRALLVPQLAVVALLALAGAGGRGELRFPPSPQVGLALGVTAALATTGAFALVLWAGRRVSAGRMAVVLAAEPLFAALFGWLLRGEALLPLQGAGAALVLAGIVSSSRRRLR
ncbi:MAG: DMT family transporter [Candidatus Bipolaricaulota bacterium]|nr:DMT family transporter [Candidatus Bipolaricaulota bacterium]